MFIRQFKANDTIFISVYWWNRALWWSWPHTGAVGLFISLQSHMWQRGTPLLEMQEPATFPHFPTFHGWQTSTQGKQTRFFLSAPPVAGLAVVPMGYILDLGWGTVFLGLAPWKEAQ